MAALTLCMIVRDEEAVIGRCLDSVSGVFDEILIADTGSHDGTKETAEKYGRILEWNWNGDFSAARNYVFSEASSEYIMWLDADDVITPQNKLKLIELKTTLDGIDAVMMRYETGFDESGRCVFSFYRERIVRRSAGFIWQGRIHEVIPVCGNIIYSDISVRHSPLPRQAHSPRNISIYESILSERQLNARERYYYGKELYENCEYKNAEKELETFVKSPDGYAPDKINACLMLSRIKEASGDAGGALYQICRSFVYGEARAEMCCEAGKLFADQENWRMAALWYESALVCSRPREGFIYEDAYAFLPYIWLCVCYDRMGNYRKAFEYNEAALKAKPDDPAAIGNKKYLLGRLS